MRDDEERQEGGFYMYALRVFFINVGIAHTHTHTHTERKRETHCRGLTVVREESGRKRSHPQRGVSFFSLSLSLFLDILAL